MYIDDRKALNLGEAVGELRGAETWQSLPTSLTMAVMVPHGSQPRCLWIVIHIQARFCSFCRFFCQSSQSVGRLCSMWHRKYWAALESLGRKAKIACVPKSHPIARLRSQITRFSVLARNFGTRHAISEENELEHSGSS